MFYIAIIDEKTSPVHKEQTTPIFDFYLRQNVFDVSASAPDRRTENLSVELIANYYLIKYRKAFNDIGIHICRHEGF